MAMLSLPAPAKINLGLWVGPRRPDGYHDIVTIIVPLELADRITFRTARTGIHFITDSAELPHGPDNLAYRAAVLFLAAARIRSGCTISLTKRIPVGAGLGGGSSDAAAVLLGLNRLFGRPLSARRLHRLALELGSDVPAFLHPGPVVARGRGEKTKPIHIPRLEVVLCLPGFGVSTSWAYQALDRHRGGRRLTAPRLSPKILGLKVRKGELDSIAGLAVNSFEEVVLRRHPKLERAKRLLLEHGAAMALLSGSGSTVYGLVYGTGTQDLMAALARHGFSCIKTHSRQAP